MKSITEVIFHPRYWLPVGYDWTDLHPDDGQVYPVFSDILIYPVLFGLFLITLRSWILNPLVFEPLARLLNLKYRIPRAPPPNRTLELLFIENNGCVPPRVVEEAAVSLQQTKREIERWLRKRSALSKLSKLDKFQGSMFDIIYRTLITTYGLVILWDTPWFSNIDLCFKDYPYHSLSNAMWWYYMVSCGFYWHQSMWQFKYSHGKDAKMAYVHHIFTIFLLGSSWACNYVRLGTLVLVVHECADIPLHVTKVLLYLKHKQLIDVIYVVFVVLWFSTRMVIFPSWILKGIFIDLYKYQDIPRISIMNSILLAIYLMNIIWSWFILKSLWRRLTVGLVENVLSSGDEEEESQNVANDAKTNNIKLSNVLKNKGE